MRSHKCHSILWKYMLCVSAPLWTCSEASQDSALVVAKYCEQPLSIIISKARIYNNFSGNITWWRTSYQHRPKFNFVWITFNVAPWITAKLPSARQSVTDYHWYICCRKLTNSREFLHGQVGNSQFDYGSFVKSRCDSWREWQQLRQLIKLGVLFSPAISCCISRSLLSHLDSPRGK